MLKRILPIIMLSCMLPTMSHASWFLNTWVKSGGGAISVDGGAPQTVVDSSVFKSYADTDTSHIVNITANAGYSIHKLNTSSGVICTGDSFTQSCTAQGPPDQNVNATFLPSTLSITATAGAGGSVDLASLNNIYYGSSLFAVRKFHFTPHTGYNVVGVTGVPTGATVSPSVPAAMNQTVTVTLPNGFVFTSNIALSATFSGPPIAKTAPSQIVSVNSVVTLDGSPSTGTINADGTVTSINTYTWKQTGGPATVTLDTSNSVLKPTFTPTVPGAYLFSLTVDGGSTANVSITATQDAASAVLNQCVNCHTANGIGVVQQVYSNWNNSLHEKNFVTCVNCHVGANSGAHPGISNPALSNICSTCHTAVPGNHPIDTAGNNACATCHDPHSLVGSNGNVALPGAHYNNITSAGYPASYMTSKADCTNCHNSNANNQTIRQQWALSGHAATSDLAWTYYDFKTMSGCVQCHTTTGFVAYSTAQVTAAWGVATDKTKEVLTCIGCHSDVANGIVRTVTPNQPFAGEPAYTNRNVGISNICMDCHSGRNNGASIPTATVFSNSTSVSYVAPHYLTAGGTLHGKSGYEFPGRTYLNYSGNSHRKIGMTNNNLTGTDGPCATCHISSAFNGAKHTFKSISSANGTISAITTTVCSSCHASAMTPAVLETDRELYNNALAVLQAALNDKGYTYSPNYPYFNTTKWGTGQAGANNMGAAFNYVLLLNEPGAYVHYSLYAKQLIADSIDAVHNNGTVTGDITGSLNDLSAKGLISNSQAASMNTYNNPASSCTNCHGNPPATAAHTANNVAPYTPSAPSCAACHVWTGPGGSTHNNGVVDLLNVSQLSCTVCHPVLSSSHAVHVGNILPLVTTYSANDAYFNGNNTDIIGYRFGCAYCHPNANPNHTNGVIVLNGNGFSGSTRSSITCSAAACHADGKGNYAASPDWYTGWKAGFNNSTDRCAMCHAAAPATGSHTAHIVNGIHDGNGSIIYPATFSCAKCHANTVDFNKNINYPNHINLSNGVVGAANVAFVAASEISMAQISPASFHNYSTVWTRVNGYKVDSTSVDISKNFLSAGNYSGGTCSTIACHNNGTTPAWGSGKMSCVACHSQL